MSDQEIRELGEVCYVGYFKASGGKSLISGAPLPAWDEQSPEIRQAWNLGAMAVVDVWREAGFRQPITQQQAHEVREHFAAVAPGVKIAIADNVENLDVTEQPAPALSVAVRALRTIAWGATPDLKPIDPSAVADKALIELRDMGVSLTGGELPEQPAPEMPAVCCETIRLLRADLDGARAECDRLRELLDVRAGFEAIAAQQPQTNFGNPEVAYEQWIEPRNPEEDISSIGVFTAGWQAAVAAASGWPLCPNGCGCRLGSEDAEVRDCACDGLCCYDEIEVSEVFAERDKLRRQLAEQPAPELAAVREVLADVLGWFHNSGQGYTVRISGVHLAREYKRAGIPLPERLRHLEGQ